MRCETANLGRNLNCSSCGVKRSEDVEFFLEDDASAITDEDLLKQGSAGADWICQYCGSNSREFEARCSSCGNNRSAEDKQLTQETRSVDGGSSGEWSEAAQKSAHLAAETGQENFQTGAPGKSFFKGRVFKLGLFFLSVAVPVIFLLSGMLVYMAAATYPAEIEVTGLEWTRSIAIEEYRTVTETAWEGEVPREARVQSSELALHHTDRIPDGTRQVTENYTEQVSDGTERYVCGRKNKKNGYFEDEYCTRTKYKTVTKTRNRTETIYKDIPIYKTRFSYLIDKWVPAGEKTTSGTNFEPHWPAVDVDNTRRREGRRTETYNLLCKELGGDNKLHKIKVSPEDWPRFQAAERLHGKTDFFGKLISIDKLPDGKW
jgi:hypothetical protein